MKINESEKNLDPLYTFKNFIAGESNKVALMAAKDMEKHKTVYLYGEGAVGKTHFLQSVGHQALDSNKSVEYISSAQWVNEFASNLRSQTMNTFRDKYQNCDILLIDDLEFLSNMFQSQEAFFHIITERKSNNRITIISSQYALGELRGISERFKNLFLSGIIIEMYPLESDGKMDIVRSKSKLLRMNLDEDIIEYIVSIIGDNLHSINGALSTLNLYAGAKNKDITLELAQKVLENVFGNDEDNEDLSMHTNYILDVPSFLRRQ